MLEPAPSTCSLAEAEGTWGQSLPSLGEDGQPGGVERGRAPVTKPVAGVRQQRRWPGKSRSAPGPSRPPAAPRPCPRLAKAGPGPLRRRFPGPTGGRVFLPVQPHPSRGWCSLR